MQEAGPVRDRWIVNLLSNTVTQVLAGAVVTVVGVLGMIRTIVHPAGRSEIYLADVRAMTSWSIVIVVGVLASGFSIWWHAGENTAAK